jgi:hypothetical protein
MLDDFTLAEDGQADPLDLGLPPTQSMRPQQQAQKADRSGLLKLAALIPLAMKAGPGAMQGLLSGWQQAQQQKSQQGAAQGRYDQQAAERQAQQASTEKYRTAQLENQRRTQQQAFLKQFVDQVGTLDDPAAVKALVDMYGGQATALGLDRPTLESYASQTATPDRMLTKKIQKRWNGLSAEEKKIAQSSGASLSIDGQLIEFDKWAPVIGGVVDPKTGAYPQAAGNTSAIDPSIPLDRQHAMALASGNTALAKIIEDAMSRQDATRRDPQRQPIQITVGGSGLTQPQVTTASGLRDDYRTESKDYFAARDGYERVIAAGTDPSPAGDMALLYGYMKLLDPNSVVRETEFATAAQSGSLPQQIGATVLKVVNGQRLTPGQRADFINRAKGLFATADKRQNSRRQRYTGLATQFGLPPNLVLGDDSVQQGGDQVAAPTTLGDASRRRVLPPAAPQRIGRFEVAVDP